MCENSRYIISSFTIWGENDVKNKYIEMGELVQKINKNIEAGFELSIKLIDEKENLIKSVDLLKTSWTRNNHKKCLSVFKKTYGFFVESAESIKLNRDLVKQAVLIRVDFDEQGVKFDESWEKLLELACRTHEDHKYKINRWYIILSNVIKEILVNYEPTEYQLRPKELYVFHLLVEKEKLYISRVSPKSIIEDYSDYFIDICSYLRTQHTDDFMENFKNTVSAEEYADSRTGYMTIFPVYLHDKIPEVLEEMREEANRSTCDI